MHVIHGFLLCDEELHGVVGVVFHGAHCVVLDGVHDDHESSNQEHEHEVRVCDPIQSLGRKHHDKGVV